MMDQILELNDNIVLNNWDASESEHNGDDLELLWLWEPFIDFKNNCPEGVLICFTKTTDDILI